MSKYIVVPLLGITLAFIFNLIPSPRTSAAPYHNTSFVRSIE